MSLARETRQRPKGSKQKEGPPPGDAMAALRSWDRPLRVRGMGTRSANMKCRGTASGSL